MSVWPSVKARRLLAALNAIGWVEARRVGSHRVLKRSGWEDVVFAFHDGDEVGPRMLARMAKHTGLTPEDL
ncbi:type II toxin-antitoxin system HicA family toxin [Brevundimonas staleyi]|uniref:Type II toxin-antitoxin system HicA family toxin n=1 Tax=Brevundimonas staleyi TaxID=74326 RepID=A0ABW0FWN1_9CAUL